MKHIFIIFLLNLGFIFLPFAVACFLCLLPHVSLVRFSVPLCVPNGAAVTTQFQ